MVREIVPRGLISREQANLPTPISTLSLLIGKDACLVFGPPRYRGRKKYPAPALQFRSTYPRPSISSIFTPGDLSKIQDPRPGLSTTGETPPRTRGRETGNTRVNPTKAHKDATKYEREGLVPIPRRSRRDVEGEEEEEEEEEVKKEDEKGGKREKEEEKEDKRGRDLLQGRGEGPSMEKKEEKRCGTNLSPALSARTARARRDWSTHHPNLSTYGIPYALTHRKKKSPCLSPSSLSMVRWCAVPCYSTARALSPCVRPLTVPTATFLYRGYVCVCVRANVRVKGRDACEYRG